MARMFSLAEVAAATSADLIGGGSRAAVRSVATDSRAVKKGALFFAIPGPRFDGHDFLPQVIEQGAAAVVVSDPAAQAYADRCPVLLVADTVQALGRLAGAYRRRFAIPVIAITGSAGKTTTKDLIAAVLRTRYRVLSNRGTQNNQIGVPLTLLQLRPRHELLVVELGTNRPGDIPWLTEIVRPDVAVLTNIGESHLERLRSPAQVFDEKAALVRGLPASGTVIVNADDPYLRRLLTAPRGRRVWSYALESAADYQAQALSRAARTQYCSFRLNGRQAVVTRSPVEANIYNILAAISCGRLFHIRYNSIIPAVERFRFAGRRQALRNVGRVRIIDDTYNANPVSLRSAVNTLSGLAGTGRRICVCADMLELGGRSAALHRQAGRLLADSPVEVVLTFGRAAREISRVVEERAPQKECAHFVRIEALQRRLLKICKPGDTILVKGSRGMRMERVVQFLEANLGTKRD